MSARARRLQLVTGKGGVGKTTLCAALALAWVERGRRPMVVELGHRASLPGVLGSRAALGWDPLEVAPGVHATNVVAERAVLELVVRWLRFRGVAERALRTDALRAFVGAAPAVNELAAMERIRVLLSEGWDPVIVDCDATGHALMFLGLPDVFAGLGASGPLGRLLDEVASLFADPELAALHLVSLPAALPVEETLHLDAALRARGSVALGDVWVNRVPPEVETSSALATRLSLAARSRGQEGAARDLAILAELAAEHAAARARVAELARRLGRGVIALGEVEGEPSIDALRALGREALAGVAP